jgi:hypothetical protein
MVVTESSRCATSLAQLRFQPSLHGTLVTVREEGFIGGLEAAYGNAENRERVLGFGALNT